MIQEAELPQSGFNEVPLTTKQRIKQHKQHKQQEQYSLYETTSHRIQIERDHNFYIDELKIYPAYQGTYVVEAYSYNCWSLKHIGLNGSIKNQYKSTIRCKLNMISDYELLIVEMDHKIPTKFISWDLKNNERISFKPIGHGLNQISYYVFPQTKMVCICEFSKNDWRHRKQILISFFQYPLKQSSKAIKFHQIRAPLDYEFKYAYQANNQSCLVIPARVDKPGRIYQQIFCFFICKFDAYRKHQMRLCPYSNYFNLFPLVITQVKKDALYILFTRDFTNTSKGIYNYNQITKKIQNNQKQLTEMAKKQNKQKDLLYKQYKYELIWHFKRDSYTYYFPLNKGLNLKFFSFPCQQKDKYYTFKQNCFQNVIFADAQTFKLLGTFRKQFNRLEKDATNPQYDPRIYTYYDLLQSEQNQQKQQTQQIQQTQQMSQVLQLNIVTIKFNDLKFKHQIVYSYMLEECIDKIDEQLLRQTVKMLITF